MEPSRDRDRRGDHTRRGSRQKRAALQSETSDGDFIEHLTSTDAQSEGAEPMPLSVGDAHSNVFYIDRDVGVILAQIDQDHYEVRKGSCILGDVSFFNGEAKWGWRFLPRLPGMRPSRKLHPNPESTLKGRFPITSYLFRNSLNP
jgi:hypothetical protein